MSGRRPNTEDAGALQSCLYVGRVRHRRFTAPAHEFEYRLFLVSLDLDELDRVFRGRWLWSARRPALAWFRRADYLGDPAVPLKRAVLDLVEARTGRRPTGPVRLLTHLRYLGYSFNPVSFYYCHDASGAVEAVVVEITNTPWNERQCYVLDRRDATGGGATRLRFQLRKTFHVSPFLDMDYEYDWRFTAPGRSLAVHMQNRRQGATALEATLVLRRRPLTGPWMARVLLRHPFMTGKVIAGIYWQALRLWWKKAPFHAHPASTPATTAAAARSAATATDRASIDEAATTARGRRRVPHDTESTEAPRTPAARRGAAPVPGPAARPAHVPRG